MKYILTLWPFPLLVLTCSFIINGNTINQFDVNLLKNPGAEDKVLSQRLPHWESIPGSVETGLLQGKYGEAGGEWDKGCKENCGLPPNPGKSYFRIPLDQEHPKVSLYQEIDLGDIVDPSSGQPFNSVESFRMAGISCGKENCVTARVRVIPSDKYGIFKRDMYGTNIDVSKHLGYVERNGKRMPEFKHFESKFRAKEAPLKVILRLEGEKAGCCEKGALFFDNVSFVVKAGLTGKVG